ncbi:MAG: hypothetical protein JSS32_04290 [Verrucomicrobia bacterium]|nr:hypothetical protein [Verrucomicrobiota bacterium]
MQAIHQMPVSHHRIPPCLENILDKKIVKAAMTCLEKLVHILCTWLYRPYRTLFQAKSERIHFFSDGQAFLIDCTRNKIAKIAEDHYLNLENLQDVVEKDRITLNGRRVLFSEDERINVRFARASYTDYVVVKDSGPNRVEIEEQETVRAGQRKADKKSWFVDLTKIVRIEQRVGEAPAEGDFDGRLVIPDGEAHLIENPITVDDVTMVEDD